MKNSLVTRKMFWISSCLILAASSSSAADAWTAHERIGRALAQANIKGEPRRAREEMNAVRGELQSIPEMAAHMKLVAGDDFQEDLEKGKAFTTGTKTEYYCRGQGFVGAIGHHKDGSESTVLKMSGNLKMSEQKPYTVVTSGDAVFELRNNFRRPMPSRLSFLGDENSFILSEIRTDNDTSRPDSGTVRCRFDGVNGMDKHCDSSSNGRVSEPWPMYMAFDYFRWGNSDSGYRLDVHSSQPQTVQSTEVGNDNIIFLKASRRVTQHLPQLTLTSGQGRKLSYKDCYQVDYEIAFDKIEPRPPRK